MAKINNSGDSRCWWGCRERGPLFHCLWNCKLVQLLCKSVWSFLRKEDIVLPEDPAIPLLGIYPKDAPLYHRGICSTVFISSFIHNSQTLKITNVPQLKNG
jgi:hypothetical protein